MLLVIEINTYYARIMICLMLPGTYYALHYAGIIGWSLSTSCGGTY